MKLNKRIVIGGIFLAALSVAGTWTRPADWPAPESDRAAYAPFYEKSEMPVHDPADAPGLGLVWQLPLREAELGGERMKDLGGAYCPTMKGHENGGWKMRYRGMHRGHDLGISRSKLAGMKIPVHAIADGVYDGQRIYTVAEPLPKDCKPLVVYHFAADGSKGVYTSIYCHVDPAPELKAGQKLKSGDVIGTVEDPQGAWGAHVHLELYTQPVYSSKDSTKLSRCGCTSDVDCDLKTRAAGKIPRGCGIFNDDLFILEPVLFIKKPIAAFGRNQK